MRTVGLFDDRKIDELLDKMTLLGENMHKKELENSEELLAVRCDALETYYNEVMDYEKEWFLTTKKYSEKISDLRLKGLLEEWEYRDRKAKQELKDLKAYEKEREAQYQKFLENEKRNRKKQDKTFAGLTKEDELELKKQFDARKKFEEDFSKYKTKLREKELKEEYEMRLKEREEYSRKILQKGVSWADKKEAWDQLTKAENEEGMEERSAKLVFYETAKLLSSATKSLDQVIDKVASRQSTIDTRLYGSKNETYMGSYWDQISRDIIKLGVISPYFTQEAYGQNIESLVTRGVAFNLEQRAFLATIKDKIAATFDVFDSSLARLIRIQQEDTTAGRLGMEAALNEFLNGMYESTEYLSDVARSVKSSLEEMEALMDSQLAFEVEAQIQKWLGSFYSVGMSQNTVSGIATTLGQIASGQIEGLTSSYGNLIIMSANQAGLSISDILGNGLTGETTDMLLKSMVEYLAELAKNSEDNNILQQQIAKVYGLKASDLKSITNLRVEDITSISGYDLTYGDSIQKLNAMVSSMGSRMSLQEMLQNAWNNGQYTLASSVANNPVTYLIEKVANLLDATVGGINIPAITVFGNGIDLNASVADLMRVAALGGGIISNLGNILQGLNPASLFDPASMLDTLGINSNIQRVSRGEASFTTSVSGNTVSESGIIGQGSAEDIVNFSTDEAYNDAQNNEYVQASESEYADISNKTINESILKIYNLLYEVVNGTKAIHVQSNSGYGGGSMGWNLQSITNPGFTL